MLNRLLMITTVALAGFGAVPAAGAGSDASAELHVVANVEPFCRLSAEHADHLQIVDGHADIGAVRELCNSAAGYEVRADFTNIDAGTVTAGSDSATLDSFGGAIFRTGEARHQRRHWTLGDAVLRAHGPVLVRLSIMPL